MSIPALMEATYDGDDLELGRVLDRNTAYTRYFVTYSSAGLTISGVMNVPTGDGPFPVLVLNHGYFPPEDYWNGRGFQREQDYLARQGYVVFHIDYRNYAESDNDPENDVRLRLGYTEDVINAVRAVKRSSLDFLDRSRIGMLGRSMGGGVTYNALVARPGLVDAAVVYAPVSSVTVDNFERWTGAETVLGRRIINRYGSPRDEPEFWENVSPVTYFDRITEPLMVHHGTEDASCPIAWTREAVSELRSADKDVTLHVYEGEQHTFTTGFDRSIRRTAAFFNKHLSLTR